MLRTHTCGELRESHIGEEVSLSGWVKKTRDKGALLWVDLRDRYGVTQLLFEEEKISAELLEKARQLGREFVITAKGKVIERVSKNPDMPTGNIEISVSELTILNASKVPPFMIEDETDGGEDLRMKYRYLDLRRNPVKESIIFRHKIAQSIRTYLSDADFLEIETPVLIKSTPEGARDFVVPSRIHRGEFYALPQSPQTFKQLLMVAGFDRYFQIVKCFRDEDLRADRQPEFTQIDCEMSFIEREDILRVFEGLTKYLFKSVKNVDLGDIPQMQYDDAMKFYGSDKPDIRFDMKFVELTDIAKGKDFPVFDNAELVVGICAKGQASKYSNKDIKNLTSWLQRPQIGAKGLVYIKFNEDGTVKSPIGKFYSEEDLRVFGERFGAEAGDMLLILSGDADATRKQLCELRLEMGEKMGLRDRSVFAPLWVIDFPLLEWDEESKRFHAMHHPFTSPNPEDLHKLKDNPGDVKANAYDLVINGVELGGGSIRIHDRELQKQMFDALGFTPEEAKDQFGFLMNAFEYGAPPHGGIAFGFDRLCALMGGVDSIRDYIAFPKNNSAKDVMIDSPSLIDTTQLEELRLKVVGE
jgi:aspartyl-tRNA synthetase